MDVDEDAEEVETRKHREEKWKYDLDDASGFAPEGSDEQDRILVDDYNSTYV